ncbi:MAG: cytochrome P450 [bacterium]|nr:cytochrome P450 [bacterium]
MAASVSPPTFDPLDPAFVADPRPAYHRVRAHAPIAWSEEKRAWIVTGHPEYLAIARDPRFSMNMKDWEHYDPSVAPENDRLRRLNENSMSMSMDKHDRIRKIVNVAFRPRSVAKLLPLIERTLDELVEPCRPTGRIDLVADVAGPFPTRVISRMIGIEPNSAREGRFKELADDVIAVFSPLLSGVERRRAEASQEELLKLIDQVILEHEGVARDDLLSMLLEAESDGKSLSRDELISLVYVLILGGTETTANSFVLGVLEMLRNPDQLELFRTRPELRSSAVMELLRTQFPGFFITRYATEDVEVAGIAIGRGQGLLVSVHAANCDPRVFPDPDRLDITRDGRELQEVFGSGRHFCLGANLARLELSTAYAKVFDTLPNLRLAVPESELRYHENVAVRSLEALPLEFSS